MKLNLSRDTGVLVQGITGRQGSFITKTMLEYGTRVLAGVTPGKGGTQVFGVPVYNTVREALNSHPDISASIIFVPAPYACDAAYEAIDNGIKLVVVITEGVPLHDEVKLVNYARQNDVVLVGPNCPGVIVTRETKIGIMPNNAFQVKGNVAVISRSGTLTYDITRELNKHGLGTDIVIGIGGDPVTGLDFIDAFNLVAERPNVNSVVIVGEIGGDAEERFAKYYAKNPLKPTVAYISGRAAPPGKRMGHAGAIISMGIGDYKTKVKALQEAGIPVAELPSRVPILLREYIR